MTDDQVECARHVRINSFEEAVVALRSVNRTAKAKGELDPNRPLMIWDCPLREAGLHWHVGRKPKDYDERIAQRDQVRARR